VAEIYGDVVIDPYEKYYLRHVIKRSRTTRYQTSDSDPPKQTSEYPAVSIRGFTTLCWQSLKILRPALRFSPAYPDYIVSQSESTDTIAYIESKLGRSLTGSERHAVEGGANYVTAPSIPDETISWIVKRQDPASMSGQPFGPVKEFKPRYRDVNVNDVFAGTENQNREITESYDIKGQLMDNIIQFDIWTKDPGTAEDLVEWFKNFMVTYEGMFRQHGVNQMGFWRRLQDEELLKWRNGLSNRSIQWYVRTEELTVKSEPLIRQININLLKQMEDFRKLEIDWASNN